MGLPVPGYEIGVIDNDGHPLPDGTTGQLALKRPHPTGGGYHEVQNIEFPDVPPAVLAAGTPDEDRDRLKQWESLTDHALLYSPSAGLDPARVRENVSAIAETVDGLSA